MDNLKSLKNTVDQMSSDHLVYLFVPEMLDRRNIAIINKDKESELLYAEVLAYIATKVNIDVYNINDIDFIQNTQFLVPTPTQIINQKPAKNIPNN